MKKSIPIIREWESEAFILGNIREREFPLTPNLVAGSFPKGGKGVKGAKGVPVVPGDLRG